MKTIKRAAILLFALLIAAIAAQAASLNLTGTVEAGVTIPVYAPVGGTVGEVTAEKGDSVSGEDVLVTFRTEKVYAPEAGTVAGVFVQPGDDAESVTEIYGADLYLEGATRFTVSASTSKAYSSADTMYVHTGETVYLVCRNASSRKGAGVISAVDGNSYTVRVTEGTFIPGDSVNIYRDSAYTDKQRLGRGSVSRTNPTAVNGTGAVVSVAVKNGDQVQRGDLLMETLTGTFDAYEAIGTGVTAGEPGVVTAVNAEAGAAVAKGDILVKIAPLSSMRVEATVTEDDRKLIHAGDSVTIELDADSGRTYAGTVKSISELPEEDTDEVTYRVIIDFTPDEHVSFGMKVVVTAGAQAGTTDAGE